LTSISSAAPGSSQPEHDSDSLLFANIERYWIGGVLVLRKCKLGTHQQPVFKDITERLGEEFFEL
jgi:hypothetical protein